MTIGSRLKAERERLKLSQTAFGELLDVGKTTVLYWEKGTAFPNAAALEKAANAGVDITYVITGERSGHHTGKLLAIEEDATVYDVKPKKKSQTDSTTAISVDNYAAQIGARLEEERKRLQLSQEMVSTLCGVSREMWGKYERGLSVMGSDVLYNFSLSGADVLYILTGLRNEQTAKTTQEISLLRAFRLLTPDQKTNLTRLVISFAGPEYFKA